MSTLLYKQSRRDIKEKTEWDICKFSPSMFKLFLPGEDKRLKSALIRLYFHVMAGKKYVIYYVRSCEGKVIHTSTVMPHCLKFQYLGKDECEIGPCYTDINYRGRGIYPSVLKYILSDYSADTFYMTVHKDNASSIRGIEKAGFERCGSILKTKLFKFYRKVQEED